MQITKLGKDPQTKVHHGRCNHCNTQVEFLASDPLVTIKPSSDPRDQGLMELHYDCPLCKKNVIVYDQR